jgi:hypothetical protein
LIAVLIGGAVIVDRKSDREHFREVHIADAQVQLERDHQILRIPNVQVKPSKSPKVNRFWDQRQKKIKTCFLTSLCGLPMESFRSQTSLTLVCRSTTKLETAKLLLSAINNSFVSLASARLRFFLWQLPAMAAHVPRLVFVLSPDHVLQELRPNLMSARHRDSRFFHGIAHSSLWKFSAKKCFFLKSWEFKREKSLNLNWKTKSFTLND